MKMDNMDMDLPDYATVQFIEDNETCICPISKVRNRSCLRPGDVRDVKWLDDVFHKAVINNIRSDGQVDVTFIKDKVEQRTQFQHIADATKLKVGDRRLVKWKDGRYYEAIILHLEKSKLITSSALPHKQCNDSIDVSDQQEEVNSAITPATNSSIAISSDTSKVQEPNPLECRTGRKGKKNWCMFCNTMQTKIGRHMAAKHKDVAEIVEYVKTNNPKLKKEIMQSIINRCNSEYNKHIIDNKLEESLIPVKQSSSKVTNTSHTICSSCGGLFSKKNVTTHKTTCQKRQLLINKTKPIESPNFSLPFPSLDKKYYILKKRILDFLNKDMISCAILKDPLILEFGRRFLKGHMSDKQRNYVGNKLRTMGDLVCRMKKEDPENISSLSDCLKVANFDLLCAVIKKWSLYDEESGVCAVGSVPRRICKSLKVCSQVEWSEAIKNKDLPAEEYKVVRQNHEEFMNLMLNDWALEVNCPGDKSLKAKKVENEDKMPEQEDIVHYFKEMSSKIKSMTEKFKKKENISNYECLSKLVLAYLIAFNCRRPSEVAYATLENFLRRNSSNDKSNSLTVFTVSATKNDTKVPVIVPNTVQEALDLLLHSREKLNIKGNLLFGRQNGTAYNGSTIIALSKVGINLKKPNHLTANGLRHYWATISQMDDKMKAHMPKFLGHTLATHQKFYEMPMTNIQLDVIGPSMISHYKIHGNDDEDPDINTDSENEAHRPIITKRPPNTNPVEIKTNQKRSKMVTENIKKKSRKPASKSSSDRDIDPDFNIESCFRSPAKRNCFSSDDEHSDESLSSPLKIQKRNRWTTPEKLELFKNLPKTVLGLEPAGKGTIQNVWENSKHVKAKHSLQMTRIEVSKYYTKKKKVPTPLKKELEKSK